MQTSHETAKTNIRRNHRKKHALFPKLRENILLFFDGIRFLSLLWRESTSENTDGLSH